MLENFHDLISYRLLAGSQQGSQLIDRLAVQIIRPGVCAMGMCGSVPYFYKLFPLYIYKLIVLCKYKLIMLKILQ
jgi:hypothetical protein